MRWLSTCESRESANWGIEDERDRNEKASVKTDQNKSSADQSRHDSGGKDSDEESGDDDLMTSRLLEILAHPVDDSFSRIDGAEEGGPRKRSLHGNRPLGRRYRSLHPESILDSISNQSDEECHKVCRFGELNCGIEQGGSKAGKPIILDVRKKLFGYRKLSSSSSSSLVAVREEQQMCPIDGYRFLTERLFYSIS